MQGLLRRLHAFIFSLLFLSSSILCIDDINSYDQKERFKRCSEVIPVETKQEDFTYSRD